MNKVFYISDVSVNTSYISRYGEIRGATFAPRLVVKLSEDSPQTPSVISSALKFLFEDIGIMDSIMVIEGFSKCLLDGVPLTKSLFDPLREYDYFDESWGVFESPEIQVDSSAFTARFDSENICLIPSTITANRSDYIDNISPWLLSTINSGLSAILGESITCTLVEFNTPSGMYIQSFDYVVVNPMMKVFGYECRAYAQLGIVNSFNSAPLTNKVIVLGSSVIDGEKVVFGDQYFQWTPDQHGEKTNRPTGALIVDSLDKSKIIRRGRASNLETIYDTFVTIGQETFVLEKTA